MVERITTLYDQVHKDLVAAMKTGSKPRMEALRSLLSAIEYEKKKTGVSALMPGQEVKILQTEVKKYEEGVVSALLAHRSDIENTYRQAAEILQLYLPSPLTCEAVYGMIATICKEDNITEVKDFGRVMKKLSPQLIGKFDGKKAVDTVKLFLEGSSYDKAC